MPVGTFAKVLCCLKKNYSGKRELLTLPTPARRKRPDFANVSELINPSCCRPDLLTTFLKKIITVTITNENVKQLKYKQRYRASNTVI